MFTNISSYLGPPIIYDHKYRDSRVVVNDRLHCKLNSIITARKRSLRRLCFYQPQRSWAKVMLLQASVILSTGGVCLSACWDTTPPPPLEGTHPPGSRPHGRTHPTRADPPPGGDTPWEAESGIIRSMSSRYTSYWNAFLL